MKKRKHIASKKNGSRKINKTARRGKYTGQKHKHTLGISSDRKTPGQE